MIQEDSIFGAEPDDLKRLVRFGLEPDDTEGDESTTPPTASVDELMERPGARIGRYKLLRVLGEGGMGVVYLAQQDKPVKRQVALKVIKPGMDSKRIMARFEAEEQALALMEHPHVARVYDVGLTGSGRPYFVMEYVEGISITEHCDKYKLTVEQRLRLFLHVCEAVQHAHQKGIIHRDLKSSNILVSIEGLDEAVPKVIDFGVAKALSQPLTERTLFTEQGQLFGTPEYMSPEQADMASEDIDTRSDIYSLGVLLYVLLTGVMPFDPKTFREGGVDHIWQVIRETDPKTPSTRLSSLGEEAKRIAESRRTQAAVLAKCLHRELEWIPLKAMRKERQERYRSASELADDIENYLKGAPLIAGPPGSLYRLKKFVRRNQPLVTGIAAVLAVLIAGVVVSTVFAIRADRARIEAQDARVDAQAQSDFLNVSILDLFNPYKFAGQDITRRSLLDVISENLEQDFTGPPLAEARIRQTLGFAYWSIGAYELASSHFEQAIAVSKVHLGPMHPTTLEWKENLGWTYIYQSRFREAEPLLTMTLDRVRRVQGDDHIQTASSMWSLGTLYWWQGRFEEAEPLFDKALEISMRQGEQGDMLTVAIMCGVTWVYWSQGRYEEAEELCNKALEINLKEPGSKDNWTLSLEFQLGILFWTLGRYEQAEQLMRETRDDRRKINGEGNVMTLWAVCGMGLVYNSQGRYDEAESLFNEALTTTQRVLGNTHVIAAYSLHRLGTVYLSQERYEEAEPLLGNALKTMSGLLGDDHPWTLDITNDFGVLRCGQQRYDEAESLLQEALEARKLKLGEDHPDTLQTINDFGVLRTEQKDYEGAEELLRQALDGRKLKFGNDHPACFESMHELAVLYKELEDYDKAEPLLIEAVNGRRLKLGDTHPHTIDSLNNLIKLYEAWNKPEKAKEWRAKLPQTGALRE